MNEKFNVEQNITGDENVQINSAGDTIAAIGDGSIAAGGNITINNVQGVDPEIHAEALKKIDELEQEVERLKANETPTAQESQSRKIMEKASELEELIEVEYSIQYLHKLGLASISIGDYEKAQHYYQESISKAKQIGSKTLLSWGYNGLSILENTRGNLNKAREYSELITNDDPIIEASNMGNKGIVECRSGNYQAGMKLFLGALDIFERENFPQGIANTLNSLGNVAKEFQNYEIAEYYFAKSIDIKKQHGDSEGAYNSLLNIGSVYRMTKKYNQALNAYFECLEIAEKNNWKPFMAILNGNIGNVHLDLNEYETARTYYNNALDIQTSLGDEIGIGLCKQNLGSLAYEMNDLELAERLLLQSAELLQKNNSEHLRNTLLGLHSIQQRRQEKL